MKQQKWLHIISQFYNYNNDSSIWIDELKNIFSLKIKEFWLTELWNFYHLFWENSYTCVICLAESHISIHTWPETSYLTLDIYVCNYQNDNSQKAMDLFEFFKKFYWPKNLEVKYIER
jgi:S-adenosylmethionine/arginine decarboxylase-like enzyme